MKNERKVEAANNKPAAAKTIHGMVETKRE
jgi:hypothetical protein